MIRYLFRKLASLQYLNLAAITVFLGVLIFIGKISVEGDGDLSKHYNNLAFVYKENNDIESAVLYWQKSSQLNETYSDIASLFLAGYDYQRYGPQKAIERLESIPDNSFMSAAKYSTLGDIQKHHNRYRDALELYRKSISINFAQIRVREEIIVILSKLKSEEIQHEIKALEWVESFY
jgi:tetratricopeptide (TPR) repeat protein